MNCFATRLILWVFTLAAFPIPWAIIPQSFQVEVLQRITLAALPQERHSVNLSERVLVCLEKAERAEIDPWLRDDIRIAWITTLYAARGNPQPHVDATYRVLGIHPDQVWPHIVARRQAMLGSDYPKFFGGISSPRKPVRSMGLAEFERRRVEQKKRAA